jgi:hypothetical protein
MEAPAPDRSGGIAMTLPNTLRVAAVLVVVAVLTRYLVLGVLMWMPFVTVFVLILLSFSYHRWPRVSAGLALVPALVIPLLVLVGYLQDRVEAALVVFDWILFGWIGWAAVSELRRPRRVVDAA